MDSDSPTYDPSTNHTTPTNLSDSKTCQQIWSRILNEKKYPKDLNMYNVNDNHWSKAKDNWATAISVAQYNFILKSDYTPPDKSNPYVCNNSDLADG